MESRVPLMVPRPVRMPRVPVRVPRLVMVSRVMAGEALVELPQAPAEAAPEAVSATRRPPARVCRSSTSP